MKQSKLTWLIQATMAFASSTCMHMVLAADTAEQTRQMQEQEKSASNIYKAYFPNIEMARKAAITFHAQLLEANYETGYMVFELTPQDMAQLKQFGFKMRPATEFMVSAKNS